MRAGALDWRGESPVLLAENRFLAVSVDLHKPGGCVPWRTCRWNWGGRIGLCIRVTGLCADELSGAGSSQRIARNLQPLWGAWRPAILAAVIGWCCWVCSRLGFYSRHFCGPDLAVRIFEPRSESARELALERRGVDAGALLMVGAISFYDLGVMDLVQLGFVFVAHLVLGWIYLLVSPCCRASGSANRAENPFGSEKRA